MKQITSIDIRDWHYRQAKGRIASHVARGTDNLCAITKSTHTIFAKHGIGRETLEKLLLEVNSESVQPFMRPEGWYQPERLERFTRLQSGLLG